MKVLKSTGKNRRKMKKREINKSIRNRNIKKIPKSLTNNLKSSSLTIHRIRLKGSPMLPQKLFLLWGKATK